MKTITHQPFLAQVMQRLNQYEPNALGAIALYFPTQLSMDYFQSLWSEIKGEHLAVPTCLTLHQFILTHSNMEEAHPFDLVRDLHALTNQILNRQASLEQFYPVGRTLLNDFDCLDQYLINVSVLPLDLMRHKQLTVPLEVLPLLYQTFTQKLIQQGKGYKGLCYRVASGKHLSEIDLFQNSTSTDNCVVAPVLKSSCISNTLRFSAPCAPNICLPEASCERGLMMAAYQKIIFIGFNLLSPAEEQFIVQCESMVPVEFFWDVDPHYLDNEINVAGYYLRKHRQKKCFQQVFLQNLILI